MTKIERDIRIFNFPTETVPRTRKLPPLPPREKKSDGAPDEVMAAVMRKALNIPDALRKEDV